MNIVHLSTTPLAGSPYSISTALSRYTEHNSRHICIDPNAYDQRIFPTDLTWKNDKEESFEILTNADIVHCHHLFHTKYSPFGNLREICKKNTIFLRQFHSAPSGIPKNLLNIIHEDPLPSFVNAQHPERYFPDSKLVPNIVLIDKSNYNIISSEPSTFVTFSPSVKKSAWHTSKPEKRWETKGYPETVSILSNLSKRLNFKFDIIFNVPWESCVERKSNSRVTIDEVVTGSYHLASLESLALGKPTLAYLDERIIDVIKEITGANWHPWLNVKLEDMEILLEHLFKDELLTSQLGELSNIWFENFWQARDLINHYIAGYDMIIRTGNSIKEDRFILSKANEWYIKTSKDLNYKTRCKQYKV